MFKAAANESFSIEIGARQKPVLNYNRSATKSLKNIHKRVNLMLKLTKKGTLLQVFFKDLTIVVKYLFCETPLSGLHLCLVHIMIQVS